MAFEISSISHFGVEVAPHTPIEEAPVSKELSISSAFADFSTVYQMGIRVDFLAFAEQHFSIGTFLATYEEYQIVRSGKFPYVRNTIGYLPADGIVIFECDIRRDMFFDVFYDFLEFIQ